MFGKFTGEHLPLSPVFTYFWTPLQMLTCKFWEMLRIFHKTPVDGSHPADIYRGPIRHDFMSSLILGTSFMTLWFLMTLRILSMISFRFSYHNLFSDENQYLCSCWWWLQKCFHGNDASLIFCLAYMFRMSKSQFLKISKISQENSCVRVSF